MVIDAIMERLSPIPLWIDTDPSGLVWTGLDCDDDLAVLVALALERRGIVDLQGISICGGNAPLQHTWPDIHRLLDHAGYNTNETPVYKGYGWRSMQVSWKSSKFYNFWNPDMHDSEEAANALIARSKTSSERGPIDILMLGPPTNLARAITNGLNISGIHHVYLMGGELTGQQLDLNFGSDPAAARVVLESELPTTMIPIQTCGQTCVTQAHLDHYLKNKEGDCPNRLAACALLPKMRQQVKVMPKLVNPRVKKWLLDGRGGRWKVSPHLDFGFVPWDVVALLAITHPDELFEEWEYHRVAVPSCTTTTTEGEEGGEPSSSSSCDKTMQVLEGPLDWNTEWQGTNWSGVVRIHSW
jgi:inosine-uridine nucleoside N-ribohydrolase